MIVRYCGGRKFEIEHRGHRVMTDQPVERRGEDTALTPTELFVGALCACTALSTTAVAVRHGLSREDVTVEAEWHEADDEPRLDAISLIVRLAHPIEPDLIRALHRAAEQCTVHRTLLTPPRLNVEVAMMSGDPGKVAPAGEV